MHNNKNNYSHKYVDSRTDTDKLLFSSDIRHS